jgi:hypothetical protein
MRTTLELDDDLLAAARQLAQKRGVTLGRIISELAWQSLAATAPPKFRNGAEIFVSRPGAPRADLQQPLPAGYVDYLRLKLRKAADAQPAAVQKTTFSDDR